MTKSSLRNLNGVGSQIAHKLARLGIQRPEDLLFLLPRRYEDRTQFLAIAALRTQSPALFCGRIEACDIRFGKRRSLLISISDDSGQIFLRFFHFSRQQQQGFQRGKWVQCYGEPRFSAHRIEVVHPEYRLFDSRPTAAPETTLTPVYPTTDGISPAMMRRIVTQAITKIHACDFELIPAQVRRRHSLKDIQWALQTVHRPPPDTEAHSLAAGTHPAQQRLVLEELAAHHLALCSARKRRRKDAAPPIATTGDLWKQLKSSLTYTLTAAQKRVIGEIQSDLQQVTPTLRLIQGDVGSGKTIVAAAAVLNAIEAGFQSALMAPTELLAEQHLETFNEWLTPLHINCGWLVGKLSAAERRETLARIESGATQLVIGTHALFQPEVKYANLGLIVVDEQHRFGVGQRLALKDKGETDLAPHQIIMSATPIPRSLAMILYADLDVSSINELPPGRKPVNTIVVPEARRTEVINRIVSICADGQQVYWVCPLIDESDKLQAQAATETFATLSQLLPTLNTELIHGRMKAQDKEAIMARFHAGDIDLLVATSVIEVGVDVPNASLMVIENAERLGLAQLHQLRGRVGRGADQAYCVLMYQNPLGRLARERIGILRATSDGFRIAQKDLELRGPGEVLGTRQTGLQQLRIANLARDKGLLPEVAKLGHSIAAHCPEIISPLIQRWIPDSDYSQV